VASSPASVLRLAAVSVLIRSASCWRRWRTVVVMRLWTASVRLTPTARRDAGDRHLSTSPDSSARATRWETAPGVISDRRLISRVVSS
jgi:hypothetical protein